MGEVANQLGYADGGPLIVLLVVLATQTMVRAVRWGLLLPRRGSQRVNARRVLPPLLVGYLGNAVLPARLGEPLRAVLVARREGLAAAASLGSVVLERVVDTATLAVIVVPAAWVAGAPRWILDAGLIAALGSVVVLFVLSFVGLSSPARAFDRVASQLGPGRAAAAMTWFAASLGQFATGVGAGRRRPLVLAAACLSALAWVLDATMIWLAAAAIGVVLSPASAILVGGMAVLGTAVPSAPAYIGTYELAASATAMALGVPPESALAMAILAHAFTVIPLAAAGAVAMVIVQRSERRAGSAAVPDGDVSPSTMTGRA